ncbi:MAG: outer membrane lipoprotein-sorting protein, partial [Desulfatitalea sp.]|nr:outer membrane lipoprotein-sorting protein [Desulfatitalea sp.]NNJ99243.1 outer membrane lipoprotein-sorting protein [Desulfatitalea sp.]
MIRFVSAFCLILLTLGVSSASAEEMDAQSILEKSKVALDSTLEGSRKIVVEIKNKNGSTTEWVARQAQKTFPDGKRSLMVLMKPDSIKGTAYLIWKPNDTRGMVQWVYVPAMRRIREIKYQDIYGSFLNTDYTFADLDINYIQATHKLLEKSLFKEKMVFKIESIPDPNYYYSKIISYIDCESYLPLHREFYDMVGRLWKKKLFEAFVVVDNAPVAIGVMMKDLNSGTSTRFVYSEICHDVKALTLKDFEPMSLSHA